MDDEVVEGRQLLSGGLLGGPMSTLSTLSTLNTAMKLRQIQQLQQLQQLQKERYCNCDSRPSYQPVTGLTKDHFSSNNIGFDF